MSTMSYSQDAIDNLFKKYNGKEGYTSVFISKDLLQLAAELDKVDQDAFDGVLSDLKILIYDDHDVKKGEVFTDEVKSIISNGSYINIMEVIDGGDKVNFYAKKDGGKIVHFLMIAQDNGNDVLLSIKGNFTTKDLVKHGKNSEHHLGLENLKKLEKIQ